MANATPRSKLRSPLWIVAFIAIVGAAVFGIQRTRGIEPTSLAGAHLFSEGTASSELEHNIMDVSSIDDVSIAYIRALLQGPDQTFWSVSDGVALQVNTERSVTSSASTDNPSIQSHAATGDILAYAGSHRGGEAFIEFLGTTESSSGRQRVRLSQFDLWQEGSDAPRALAFISDGSLLLSRPGEAGIDVLAPDRSELWTWVGQPDDDAAELELAEPLGEIVSLVALPDDRIVFVADTSNGDRSIYLLDGEGVAPVETDSELTVDTVDPQFEHYARPIDHLSNGPGSTVIVSGMVGDSHPRISLLDVDTGEVDVLAELEDVEISSSSRSSFPDSYLSATAVEDDLIFLADQRLWILEDAFAGTES